MCFDFDSRPPELPSGYALRPVAGGAGAERVELTSADGARFAAAIAESPQPAGAAVVILPDVRGMYRFYVELAERFAAAGHHAVVIDYFGRITGTGEREEDFEYMPHIRETTPEQIRADAAAGIAALRERVGETAVVAVGFCFGGTQTYLAAAAGDELPVDGFVAFYGGLDGSRVGAPSPPDYVEAMRGPILGLFGGADAGIPVERIEAFDGALTEAGVEHEIVVYPGAPHSFFDRKYAEHADACADAWRRVLDFLGAVRVTA
jgi:carboxymethylenebutenolidase